MNSASTKGNSPVPPQREPARATSARVLRQVAAVIVVVAVWSALLVGYLALTDAGKESETTTPQPAVTTVPTGTPAAVATQPPTAQPEATLPPVAVSFANDILPLFAARCERCHGGALPDAELSLTSHVGVMAGSANGPVVIPGSAATSRLVQVIRTGQMPKRAPKLPGAEIQTISDWVDAGAPDN